MFINYDVLLDSFRSPSPHKRRTLKCYKFYPLDSVFVNEKPKLGFK